MSASSSSKKATQLSRMWRHLQVVCFNSNFPDENMQLRLISLKGPPFLRRISSLPKDVSGSMPNGYQPAQVESGWYDWWQQNNYFEKEKAHSNFSMVLPPPNITGTLHLGHALTCAIQDCLVRWNRMNGKNTMWFPGCDHAGIATQVIVEKNLSARNMSRQDLGRDKFVQEIWKWKSLKEETIYKQLKIIGSTLHWDKSVFTMDPKMTRAVNEAFIRLHNQGKIYRKESLVNWSCRLQSAISDIEVDHRVINGPTPVKIPGYDKPVHFGYLFEFSYKVVDSNDEIVVSTTRPETMIGDTAIAVHPNDSRYNHLIGKFVFHPIRNVKIPIIADGRVDPNFGTGALKITPAHDPHDYEIAESHGLTMLNIFDDRGKANENCGQFRGLNRFELRQLIIDYLKQMNLMRNIYNHTMSIPICSRSGDVVEPLLRPQWYASMQEMGLKALEAVQRGELTIQPNHFENVWSDWLENIKDWCISRQLWWGHRIPVYKILSDGKIHWIAAHSQKEALRKAQDSDLSITEIEQEEDVLDTWFSSSLFPFAVCGWPDRTADLQRYFPLSVMETGHDILFFWVARMVMMSLELTGQLPFKQVVLHGIICDSQGRKMSKSLGNVIDPLDVIHGVSLQDLEKQLETSRQTGHLSLEEFEKALQEKRMRFPDGIPQIGADALRFTLCSYNVKNHFINLDLATMKRNRLFCNKIWQLTRFLFILMDRSQIDSSFSNPLKHPPPNQLLLINQWILSRLNQMINQVSSGLANYDFHQATEALYQFIYGELCDVYLEAIKPLTGDKQKEAVWILTQCLDVSLKCLAPFMPYLTEELYQRLHNQLGSRGMNVNAAPSILIAPFPQTEEWALWKNDSLDKEFDLVMQVITEIRSVKLQYGMVKSEPSALFVCEVPSIILNSDQYRLLITTLAGLSSVEIIKQLELEGKGKRLSRTIENCSVHLDFAGDLNHELEIKKSYKKVEKLTNQLQKLEKTVNAPSYATSAPSHVQESHKKKVATLQEEIRQIQNYIEILNVQTNT